jgi:8-amino-7-oxononanoate synthase
MREAMTGIDEVLSSRLLINAQCGLHRRLREINSPQGTRIRFEGRELVNFSSNDYLGLAGHPALKEAAVRAVHDFGAGAGASRLICGSLKPFHELEAALAAFKGAEAGLTFSTGYAAALGAIPALLGKDDVIVLDKRVHACLVDAARLSGAKLRVCKHNDLADLERILKWTRSRNPDHASRCLVITESVFSMDGDLAPLQQIVELKDRYGAWLLVDEAHATGLFGERRSGLIEQLGLSGRVEIQMGTLGKAVGAAGGFICGSRTLIDFLINSARSFIFSTAPVPASAAAARAGLELIQSAEGAERRHRVWERAAQAQRVAGSLPLTDRQNAASSWSPILPLIIGDENAAVALADSLRERGFFIPAIRYPTVARGSARLRMTITADHTAQDIDQLASAFQAIANHES